ncbi:MAG: hypothetical protein KDA97_09375 [Acidimicrobiales bacterium]|nr:hypothetical protein [Acidimicrobiales bacterium]
MFRRRRPPPAASEAPAPVAGPSASELTEAGWALPRGIGVTTPRWTLVGTVDSPLATPVDPAGLVVGDGWSLDWWIGADDRWHVPAREAAVRQDVLDDVPVVETRVRIPGGDAVARAYGVRAPRGTGDEWVVVEIENLTPVPFAVALAVRPVVADGLGSVGEVAVQPVAGGTGRDEAHLVRVDGRPAVVLPRRPQRSAVGSYEAGDALDVVVGGDAGTELATASCPDGLATAAYVFPLPHTAVLRVVLPVGEVDDGEAVAYPSAIGDAATVASGWEVHTRGPRFELPDARLAAATARARAQVRLAHDGTGVRRDGNRSPDLEPGATDLLLGAFDVLDRPAEVGTVVARWQERFAHATPPLDALLLHVVARHWMLHRVDELLDWMLPEVAAAIERIDRADRKGQLANPADRSYALGGLTSARRLLDGAGQHEAGRAVDALVARMRADERVAVGTGAVKGLIEAERLLGVGDPAGIAALDAVLDDLSATSTWPGPGPDHRPIGHDLAAAGALVLVARNLLVREVDGGLDLLSTFPDRWYGGGIELHDAPTGCGRLSYAVRWHGTRPALLWELEPHDGLGPWRIAVPGLDPSWSTTELRGEALLAEVAPPEGLETVTVVAEHPDIDPEMRRPGAEPEAPADPLPEGGSFS